MIINTYAPNIGALNYVRQILIEMKNQIDNKTVSYNRTYHTIVTKSQINQTIISKEITELNQTCEQMDLVDVY